jgi:hypothetical protein
MVNIYVGLERKHYLIHKDILTKQSEFFDRAWNGRFKEAEDNSIYIEEESPAAFDLLMSLLYKGHVRAIGPPFGGFPALEIDVRIRDPLIPGALLQLETPGGTSYRRLVGPVQVDVHMTTVSDVAPPKNRGTSKVAYQPYSEQTPSYAYGPNPVFDVADLFASICAQKQYRRWSYEELRLADYQGNKEMEPPYEPSRNHCRS